MKAQASDEQRRAIATYLVDNGGSLDELRAQVTEIWRDLQAEATKDRRHG